MDHAADDISWYVVEKTYWVIDKGLILVGAKETAHDFRCEIHDAVEIVRPNGTRTRARVQEVYESISHAGGDLLVEGLRASDVPPGSRLRVLRPQRKRRQEAQDE